MITLLITDDLADRDTFNTDIEALITLPKTNDLGDTNAFSMSTDAWMTLLQIHLRGRGWGNSHVRICTMCNNGVFSGGAMK